MTNVGGFPKAAELVEITGTHALEASDRAIFNHLLQTAHDSGRLAESDAEWEISLAALRRSSSRHESNDRLRESLRRLRRTEVRVTYVSVRTGQRRTMETHLLEFTDTDEGESENATLQFGIPKRLRLILVRSNRWGRVRCEVAYAMTSKYAIALYEKICLCVGVRNHRRSCSQTARYSARISCQWGERRAHIICHCARHHRAALANGGSCSHWLPMSEMVRFTAGRAHVPGATAVPLLAEATIWLDKQLSGCRFPQSYCWLGSTHR